MQSKNKKRLKGIGVTSDVDCARLGMNNAQKAASVPRYSFLVKPNEIKPTSIAQRTVKSDVIRVNDFGPNKK